MAIITLTSDWGLSDYYVPAVKGAIFSALSLKIEASAWEASKNNFNAVRERYTQ